MSTVISILIAVVVFCVIIIVHELGHFFVAKLCGMRVSEFAIGMGPKIFKKQGKETLYTIRLFPIGGFCSLGEDEESSDERSFRNKPVRYKIAVIAAGAIMNLVLGLILSIIVSLVSGKAVSTTVVYFADNAESAKYGLQLNDEIVRINGVKLFTANDIIYQLGNDEDGVVDFEVKRNGELVKLNGIRFNITTDEQTGERTLVYDFKVRTDKITAANLLPYSVNRTLYFGRIIILSLVDIIKGKYGLNDLQGPVGIVSAIGDVAKQSGLDISFILNMAILITINVGIFNLLPLPALDGGRLIFLYIEGIRRKQIKADIEGAIHFVGFALLMLLMVVVTFNDIKNLFVK
jgi:regulator of sigma E protease